MKLIVKALMVDSNTEDREGFLWRERERETLMLLTVTCRVRTLHEMTFLASIFFFFFTCPTKFPFPVTLFGWLENGGKEKKKSCFELNSVKNILVKQEMQGEKIILILGWLFITYGI
jgi:hypothetical protein